MLSGMPNPPRLRPASSARHTRPGRGDTRSGTPAATTPQPLLSIVVPTRNEAANVRPLWDQLNTVLAGTDFEVCFVDDSDDATPTLLTQLAAANTRRVHCHFRKGAERVGGLATAVFTGLRLAQGRYVCVMDADLQHRPDTIPAMLAAAEIGADLVVASRYTQGGSRRGLDGLVRRLVSRTANLVARLLFSEARRSTDPLSGFFLCRRDLINGIEFRPVGFKILLELLVCVPRLRVVDVPLDFAPRAGGASKASTRQGALFVRHLGSLFFRVDGSARMWKFGLVGLSGLALFEGLLWLLTRLNHVDSLLSFAAAFVPSLAWNTVLNRRWTFADLRHQLGNREPLRYLEHAAAAGVVMFVAFLAMMHAGVDTILAGLLAALMAMLINGLTNYRSTHRLPVLWSEVAFDKNVKDALDQLARRVGADRAYVLPPRRPGGPGTVPGALFDRVVSLQRGSVFTETTSYRPQRRTNIDVASTLLVPVVVNSAVAGVVVLERTAPRGFGPSALGTAIGAVGSLGPSLLRASGVHETHRMRAMAARRRPKV